MAKPQRDDVFGSSFDLSARRVAMEFARPGLTVGERNLAIDAFRLLARDADVAVRAALADALRDEPLVPHDVVHALALDVQAVALPLLEHSIVLSDEDLLQVLHAGEAAQRRAIARRAQVSSLLADALVATQDESVILTVMRNPGAEVSELGYDAALLAFPESPAVLASIVRHVYTIEIVESLGRRADATRWWPTGARSSAVTGCGCAGVPAMS